AIDEWLLVALEDLGPFGNDLGQIRREIGHRDCSIAAASATSVASVPGAPRIERPTGRPSTSAPGTLTCGTPVRPPCAQRHRMRSRTQLSAVSDWPFRGAGNGVVGRHTMVPGASRYAMR